MALSTVYINHYHCPYCDIEWIDEWDCMCNDRCPTCDREIEPYWSEREGPDE